MEPRITFQDTRKGMLDTLLKVGQFMHSAQLDPKLQHLLAYRVSQINGCAFCLDMHHKDAIAAGDTEQRLHGMPAWKDSPYYSDAERAAFQLAEELTAHHEASDATFAELEKYFSKEQIADITLGISMTGTWNRINKVFRTPAGNYKPGTY
ncbi:carboxymuconolactone decarboxylase family protein [Dinghuibacter silviterrae]|uniref:AhpD family alkylhydroperoxidase n=1 Tax=Dinghuibacter silviterrae TaxID=1539049 RepID=A0A4R8DIA5_9BACT|nr:carboxymuconolactone decarboxylase family protein [Dinghuibacter silviterrae]TDW96886.1 AhpD family alkylhydroperoxidase [Dinghuibacter silviterrae]